VTEFGLDGARRLAQEAHRSASTALADAGTRDPAQLQQITDFIAHRSF
jgi:hypothetical protein